MATEGVAMGKLSRCGGTIRLARFAGLQKQVTDAAQARRLLAIAANISLLPLPPRSRELNSQENKWQFMRQNWLSNRPSNLLATSSITAATHGIHLSSNRGRSCPSRDATGRPSVNHY